MLRLVAATISIVMAAVIIPLGNDAASAESIKWGTVLADDYDRGVAEKKPIVVLFYDITTSRPDSDVLSVEIIGSVKLQKIADSVVWSFADVSNDLVAKNIAKALGITTFPTISVLKPDGEALDETARVVGLLPIGTTEIGVMRGIEGASKK
ncbi:MAG: hypothetical protein ABI451_11285 [Dokdonella sp.]